MSGFMFILSVMYDNLGRNTENSNEEHPHELSWHNNDFCTKIQELRLY